MMFWLGCSKQEQQQQQQQQQQLNEYKEQDEKEVELFVVIGLPPTQYSRF